jgi:signal transduction histidine kinase
MHRAIQANLVARRPEGRSRLAALVRDRRAIALHAYIAVICGVLVTGFWAASGGGYFWPVWVWFAVAVSLGLHWVGREGRRAAAGEPDRWLWAHAGLDTTVVGILIGVWLLAGAGGFWPVWPLLGIGAAFALHTVLVRQGWLPPSVRERALSDRVDELTRTRRGALDVQAAELRRIERDLHDGAQARLVALSMLIGRAEERLADRPEVAALVRQARDEASAAISELRDLARGIAPPVLADRGLAAALEALGRRTGVEATVEADLRARPLPIVETAAYFVVAESLTNIAKHAPGATARVTVSDATGNLDVEVADDGPGGADPAGGGLSGLRSRVEALDGTLVVTSPPGYGTRIRAVLPCE